METKRNLRIRNAIHLALGMSLAAGLAAAPASAAEEEEAAELERVTVTGSRISRLDLEGALPVTVIDRESIELSGEVSVADLLRGTSFNSGGSFRPQSGSSAQSFAGLSLRNLGEGRTLILIDGRRAPVAPNVGSAQDLNAIPLAAVERIEILSDGASAIYGSDAIGGVVNIITRKDFTGAEVTVGASDPKREGGSTAEFSALMGVAGDRGQVMFGVSRNYRDIVFQRERPWSTGGASVYSNNYYDFQGATTADGVGNWYVNPTYGTAVPADGCTGPGFTASGTGADTFCFYDFTAQAADEAELENQSLFVRGTYDVNSDWRNYFNASLSRVESFGRYAPVPSSPWPGGLPYLEAGSPNHPATIGGNNPLAADYQDVAGIDLMFTHRFAALGPRDNVTDANVYDVNVGFEGRIGNFDLDVGVRDTESRYYGLGRNYVVGGLAQQFIDDGTYNIYDPFSVTDDVANAMIATTSRDSIFTSQEVYAIASTDLFDMPAGMVSAAFGAEYRDEFYSDTYDSLSEGGQVVGSSGNSAGLGRSASALFFETLVPVLDNLEMNLAGRYDRYSDYGSDFSPKIAFRFTPTDDITLRASYGQGFRAPTLDILSAKPSFSAAAVVHGPTADHLGVPRTQGIQLTTWQIANPDLSSEQSDQFSFGVAFEPTNWFSGSVDYSSIEVDNRTAFISAQRVIDCLDGTSQNCPPGLSILSATDTPPIVANGLGAAYRPNGSVVYAQTGYTNLGTITTDVVDINLRTNFELGAGQLTNNLQMSQTLSYEVDSGADIAGDQGLPETRLNLENVYAIGDFSFAWNINYIGAQDTSLGNEDAAGNDTGVDSWLTHNLQVNWFAPWQGRVTAGIMNVTDEDPPLDPGESRGFNWNLYNGYGRIPYLRYTQSF